jgi:hypothetical protein
MHHKPHKSWVQPDFMLSKHWVNRILSSANPKQIRYGKVDSFICKHRNFGYSEGLSKVLNTYCLFSCAYYAPHLASTIREGRFFSDEKRFTQFYTVYTGLPPDVQPNRARPTGGFKLQSHVQTLANWCNSCILLPGHSIILIRALSQRLFAQIDADDSFPPPHCRIIISEPGCSKFRRI